MSVKRRRIPCLLFVCLLPLSGLAPAGAADVAAQQSITVHIMDVDACQVVLNGEIDAELFDESGVWVDSLQVVRKDAAGKRVAGGDTVIFTVPKPGRYTVTVSAAEEVEVRETIYAGGAVFPLPQPGDAGKDSLGEYTVTRIELLYDTDPSKPSRVVGYAVTKTRSVMATGNCATCVSPGETDDSAVVIVPMQAYEQRLSTLAKVGVPLVMEVVPDLIVENVRRDLMAECVEKAFVDDVTVRVTTAPDSTVSSVEASCNGQPALPAYLAISEPPFPSPDPQNVPITAPGDIASGTSRVFPIQAVNGYGVTREQFAEYYRSGKTRLVCEVPLTQDIKYRFRRRINDLPAGDGGPAGPRRLTVSNSDKALYLPVATPASFSGNLSDSLGRGVPGATVWVEDPINRVTASVITDATGAWVYPASFGALTPTAFGAYVFRFSSENANDAPTGLIVEAPLDWVVDIPGNLSAVPTFTYFNTVLPDATAREIEAAKYARRYSLGMLRGETVQPQLLQEGKGVYEKYGIEFGPPDILVDVAFVTTEAALCYFGAAPSGGLACIPLFSRITETGVNCAVDVVVKGTGGAITERDVAAIREGAKGGSLAVKFYGFMSSAVDYQSAMRLLYAVSTGTAKLLKYETIRRGVEGDSLTVTNGTFVLPVDGKEVALGGIDLEFTGTIEKPPSDARGMLDCVFCIDTTGSMTDDIESVKKASGEILTQLSDFGVRNNISLQYGLVTYQDHADAQQFVGTEGAIWLRKWPMTVSCDAIRDNILSIKIAGMGVGGDPAEDLYAALLCAVDSRPDWQNVSVPMGWRAGAAKIVIPISDASAHDPDFEGHTLATVALRAESLDPVHVYPLLLPKSGLSFLDGAAATMERVSSATGGEVMRVNTATELPGALVTTVKAAVRRHREEVWRKEHPPYALYITAVAIGVIVVTAVALAIIFQFRRPRSGGAGAHTQLNRLDPTLTGESTARKGS